MPSQFLSMEKLAAILLTLAAFLLTLWRFGGNQCFALVAVMVVLYRPWRRELFRLDWIKQPVILGALALVAFALISLSYSETPTFVKALQGMGTYSKLLYLLVFPIALQATKYRKWLENGLIYGVLINVILSTLYHYQVPLISAYLAPHMSMDLTFTINPLQMIYIVVMAMWLLVMRLFNREFHWLDILILALFFFYLWFINGERSGYLLFLALVLLALGQKFGKKAVLLGCIILPLLFFGLYEASPTVKARVDLGINNIVAYHEAASSTEIGADNSLGLRLAFAKESFDVIKEHPLFGTGIGSFKYVFKALYPVQAEVMKLNDPHNAYTYVTFELGFIGLVLYVIWLYAVWKFTRNLNLGGRNLLRGVWLMFVVMGFTDSGFALNAVGFSFILWISLYLREKAC